MKIETEEYRLIKNDGSEITVLINAAPMYGDEKICGARISITDITHRRRLEVQLQSAQKMKAITTLAGGIAHEFNNALVGITGNIELLKMNLGEDKDVDKYIEKMIGSAGRMAKHTKQLLAYARGGKYWPKIISLRALVEDALALIRHTIQPSIRVQTDLRDDASHVEVDVTQMQLVLSAVLTNASEAIEGDGLIRIVIGNQEIIETSMDEHPGLKPGHYACLTIEDDGKGMESETRDRIFEPFFTTNFQGRGLGMAATYGIVKNHNGWIGIDSEPGKGTTVRIYLPAIDA
jgi:signal transduction histidine kinase